MLDTLQVVFWSITYLLIIIAGYQSKKIKLVSMPYVAGVLNFSWEICALYNSKGLWGHVLWLFLDLIIVFFSYNFIKDKKQKIIYASSIIVSTAILFLIFKVSYGMLFSVFIIDMIMALCFLIYQKQLSPHLKIPIAVTKLLGDAFAGLYYAPESKIVAIIAILVFICNSIYLALCIKEYVSLDKKQYYKLYAQKSAKQKKNEKRKKR